MTLKLYGAHDLVDALIKTDFTRANLAGARLNQADVKARTSAAASADRRSRASKEARNRDKATFDAQ
jgi:hypothetical protein